MKTSLRLTVLTAVLASFGAGAHAQETIRIGLVAPFSGPYADYGKQMEAGMKVYMRQHGDSVDG
jgi:branched-chain amino acid transport system substrate-binding protein